MDSRTLQSRIRVVLNEPQDPVNIGAAVRAMKNMGLARLHLVRPDDFDAYRIEGVAHTGMDIIESARQEESLGDAIADCVLVLGTSARGRRVRRNYRRPREAAAEVWAAAAGGDVAIVFGREDRGLSNEQLDLCGRVVVIPTDPEHSSLNLAQAVLILAYEIFLASGEEPDFKTPKLDAPAATSEQLEDLYWDVEAGLHAVDFFKSQRVVPIMRSLRDIGARAELNSREVALLRAITAEMLRRAGA